jgi:two-component system sensor histidine kinase YesM
LQIQEYRFEKQCDCRYVIPGWALDLSIVKFSLQPLVENCLIHGLRADGQALSITISATRQGQNLIIMVVDNGNGISPQKLAEMRLSLEQTQPGPQEGSIGLRNLHRRIVNLFGEEYGLSIDSEQAVGTSVTIRFPIEPTVELATGGEYES